MGYRSEVHLGIDEAIVEQLLTFAGVNQECYKLLFEYADATEKTKKGGIYFRWEHVKWYDSYDEISKLQTFLQEHDDHYKFLRLGESVEDVEEEGYSEEYYFSISRSVDVDYE